MKLKRIMDFQISGNNATCYNHYKIGHNNSVCFKIYHKSTDDDNNGKKDDGNYGSDNDNKAPNDELL